MKIIFVLIITIFSIALLYAQTNKNKKMNNNLKSEYISTSVNAKTVLLFGGNIERRHEIIELLLPLTNVSVYGSLSEEEGIEMLAKMEHVDVVLIGGRYTDVQRINIRKHIAEKYAHIQITEPGIDYPYSNEAIFETIKKLTNEAK